MLRGEVVPLPVHVQVPDVNTPGSDGVHDDEAREKHTIDTEYGQKHLHEQVCTAATIDTEDAKDNKGKGGPKDNIIEVVTDHVGADDDDTAGNVKNTQNGGAATQKHVVQLLAR